MEDYNYYYDRCMSAIKMLKKQKIFLYSFLNEQDLMVRFLAHEPEMMAYVGFIAIDLLFGDDMITLEQWREKGGEKPEHYTQSEIMPKESVLEFLSDIIDDLADQEGNWDLNSNTWPPSEKD